MKMFLSCLAGLFTLLASPAWSQTTSTLSWNTSFSPAWADSATFGMASNIGGSDVNSAVNISKFGGTWIRSLYSSGAMTPTKNGSYNVGTAAAPENLMLALDYTGVSDYVLVDIVFSRPVYQLSFAISDIDRHFKNRNDFMDEVVVEANGRTAHPTFSTYMTDPNFPDQLQFSGDTVRVNPDGALSGNAGPAGYPTTFDAAEQAGTVLINFGATPINSLRIRYGSAVGSLANPSIQAIAIGSLTFRTVLPVLASLSLFDAQKTGDGVLLQWDARNEAVVNHYAIEYSRDGESFSELTTKPAQNTGAAAHYSYLHKSGTSGYYRLKTVEADGSFTYSSIAAIKGGETAFNIHQVYPTKFSTQLTLQAELPDAGEACIYTYTMGGVLLNKTNYTVAKGVNSLAVKSVQELAAGTYLFCLRYKEESRTVKAIKQ